MFKLLFRKFVAAKITIHLYIYNKHLNGLKKSGLFSGIDTILTSRRKP